MAENKTNNQLVNKEQYYSLLAKQTDIYTNMVAGTMEKIQIEYTPYQKICVANAIAELSKVLREKKLNIKDFNQDEITNYLLKVAMLKLNASATPKEMFVSIRNNWDDEKKCYRPSIDFGVEGNGNDAILRNFGVNVAKVKTPLIIREGDEFTYPYFDGEKMQPITWRPKSFINKVIAVCYIVEKSDGTIEYLISERESVAKNLKAHISNNLLGKDYKDIRQSIIDKINNYTLDQLFEDKDIQRFISPAWKNGSSKEDMILRKMQNNATKKYPKNFESAFTASAYESTFEDYDQYRKVDVGETIDYSENTSEKVIKEINENSGTVKVESVINNNQNDNKVNVAENNNTNDDVGF